MSTTEPTPPAPSEGTATHTERRDTNDTVTNTVMTLTVEEAQTHWDDLIDHVITTQGPVHIASPTGRAGAVLISIDDYHAWQAQIDLQRSTPPTTSTTQTAPDDDVHGQGSGPHRHSDASATTATSINPTERGPHDRH